MKNTLKDSELYQDVYDFAAPQLEKNILVFLLLCVFIMLPFRAAFSFCFYRVQVSGSSMYSTLIDNDYVYINRFSTAERGDIIVMKVENHRDVFSWTGDLIIKRLIAKEGDTIRWEGENPRSGYVYIKQAGSTEFVKENYTKVATPKFEFGEGQEYTLKEKEIFFLGDNRAVSEDSTEIGCFKEEDILGVMTGWSYAMRPFFKWYYSFNG